MPGEDHLKPCKAVVTQRASNEDAILVAELFDFNSIIKDNGPIECTNGFDLVLRILQSDYMHATLKILFTIPQTPGFTNTASTHNIDI